jgi:hypothetical protein
LPRSFVWLLLLLLLMGLVAVLLLRGVERGLLGKEESPSSVLGEAGSSETGSSHSVQPYSPSSSE